MNNNYKKSKKYFFNDEELTSFDDDILNQRDIVNNLKLIIENANPKCNIALIGKYGTGKSSIINLLLEEYKSNKEEYVIQKINVWKNKDRCLNDVFIEETLQNLNIDRIESLSDSLNNDIKDNNDDINKTEYINEKIVNKKENGLSKKLKNIFKLVMECIWETIQILTISILVSFIIFICFKGFESLIKYNEIKPFFLENILSTYFKNFAEILILPLLAVTCCKFGLLIKNNKKQNEQVKSFEISVKQDCLTTAIHKNLNTNKNRKIITVIEDIDKLPINSIVNKLDEIKGLEDFENCIFIFPFDEYILKKALYIDRISKIDVHNEFIKSENILDKLYQYKIYIPPFLNLDIKDYAVNLVKQNIPNFIAEYCPIEEFENIIRKVLIHKNVTSPRQVKRIVNNFVNNKIMITNRFKRGDITEDIVNSDKFDYKLAKISVIQAEFNEFYNLLFTDVSCINKIIETYNLKFKFDDIDENLKRFFVTKNSENGGITKIKPKYKGLVNFLLDTAEYDICDVLNLIYSGNNGKVNNSDIENVNLEGNKLENSDVEETSIDNIKQELQENSMFSNQKEDYNSELQTFETLCIPDNKDFIIEFVNRILDEYNEHPESKLYFEFTTKVINISREYVDTHIYEKYLKTIALNLQFYPREGITLFKSLNDILSEDISIILLHKAKDIINKDLYEDYYEVLQKNSDYFYDEKENLSEYVKFLVDNIVFSDNPNNVIQELDENFNRISRTYNFNKNIKNLNNIDYNKAFEFLAKCLDNASLERMIIDVNNILEDDEGAKDCLNIETKMKNYNLISVIESDIKKLDENEECFSYNLLKNLLEICANKQNEIHASKVIRILNEIFIDTNDYDSSDFDSYDYDHNNDDNSNNDINNDDNNYEYDNDDNNYEENYVLEIFSILKSFDRMYFYELRKDFNEILYTCFHNTDSEKIKLEVLDCAKYFKNTLLFRNKLDGEDLVFYTEHK